MFIIEKSRLVSLLKEKSCRINELPQIVQTVQKSTKMVEY